MRKSLFSLQYMFTGLNLGCLAYMYLIDNGPYTWQRSDEYSKFLMEKDDYDRDQSHTSSRDAEVSKEMTGYHSDYNTGDTPP